MSIVSLERAIVDGVLTGSIYALMAAGLALIYGVLEVINVAQGPLVILGAYLSYAVLSDLGIGIFEGLAITIPFMFICGVVIDFVFLRRLKTDNRVGMSILVTYGAAIIIVGIVASIFGIGYLQLKTSLLYSGVAIGKLYVPWIFIDGGALAVGMFIVIFGLLYRTRFGRSLRAATENPSAAELVGVRTARVRTLTFGIGVAVTAAGGMVFGATSTFSPNTGYDLIVRLLAIIILGGLGSIGGAIAAALGMLVVEDIVAVVWSPVWAEMVFFIVLIVVLVLRPEGLFGQKAIRSE